jgi:RNA polymerase sigma-70 factor (ECF subfamily)
LELSVQARFEQLYKAHGAAVERCVASFGLPRHVWPDILQDVWMTAVRRLDEVIAHPRPIAWLCTVARNHAMHYVRGHLRRERKTQAVAVELIQVASDPCRDWDSWATLSRLLADCPLEQREIYLKIELHGMTAGEVAVELGLSVNTIHSRLRLARQRLRESSAALGTLILLLREHLVREGVALPPKMSSESLVVSASEASQHTSVGMTGKAALIALLILPAADSRQEAESRLGQPAAAAPVDPPSGLDSVHVRVIQVPFIDLRSAGMAVRLVPSDAVAVSATLRRQDEPRRLSRRKATAPSLAPGPMPLDDGESLLQAAEKAYGERRFEHAWKNALKHRRLYPASELRDSREILVAKALCQLGHDVEAKMHVRTFARESPDERAFRARLGQLREECR